MRFIRRRRFRCGSSAELFALTMRRADQITEKILSIWGTKQVASVCVKIIDFVVEQPDQLSMMITFTDLSRISGLPAKSRTLVEAVSILSSSFGVLDWMFVYFRDESSDPYYLSEEESRQFIQKNEIADHETGETVENPGSKLMPYFRADKKMLCAEIK